MSLPSQDLRQAWGEWLQSLDNWQWFVTVTFRDPYPNSCSWTRPGWATAKRAWRDFTAFCRPALGELTWVRMFELQRERGVPHIHALVGNLDSLEFREVSAMLWQRYGFNRILRYDPELGANFYLTKYVTKELADIEFSPSLARSR